MMFAVFQVTFLLLTAWKLQSFDKSGHTYRPIVSFLAACWAGACLSLAVAIILHWPEVIGWRCVIGTMFAGAGCAAAFWCGGNVAELLRKCRVISW